LCKIAQPLTGKHFSGGDIQKPDEEVCSRVGQQGAKISENRNFLSHAAHQMAKYSFHLLASKRGSQLLKPDK